MEKWILVADRIPIAYFKIGVRYLLLAGLAFVIFYIIFKHRPFFRKIQPKFPLSSDYLRDFAYSAFTVFIFSVISLITMIVLRPYTLLVDDISAFGWGYHFFSLILMFFLHDAYFYWIHRLMHWPFLYRRTHRVHHLSTNPSPWTAYAFHPLEAVLEVLIVPLIALTIPTHSYMIFSFMLFQIAYNVYGHLGYELYPKGFDQTILGRWINTSVAHNLHHHKFHGNYGLYTLIWDRLFGTLRTEYHESFENATNKPVVGQGEVV